VAVHRDGRIVAGGSTHSGGPSESLLVRLTPEGALDNSFHLDGKRTDGLTTNVSDIAIQVDDKIAWVSSAQVSGSDTRSLLVRLKPNGDPDPQFADAGYKEADLAPGHEHVDAIAIGRGNKLTTWGNSSDGGQWRFVTARFFSGLPPDCTIAGTPGPDSITGTSGKDYICGLGGSDTIQGLGGNDVIKAGGGQDGIFGGAGADRLGGQSGNDVLLGEGGPDRLKGGPGNDLCQGGPGADRISASCERTSPS
jgi:Ca2+-binding RTX toxin-like protein